MRRTALSEAQIHKEVVRHLCERGAKGLIWWHTPNDGKRSPATAKRLQMMGMLPGVSDLILLHRGHAYALELKTERTRPTVDQMQFASAFNQAGGHACICHDLDRALRVLETWGLLRGAAA